MNRYRFDSSNHIHLLDHKPLMGTSTISGVISKGSALSWWASSEACKYLGWMKDKDAKGKKVPKSVRMITAEPMLEAIKKMEVEEYIKLLDGAYRAHKDNLDESASKGTDLHAELESFIKFYLEHGNGNIFDVKDKRIIPFIQWSEKNVKRFLWSEAHCYSERLRTGGIGDAGALMNSGKIAAIDFKSSKEAYTSHFIQTAGYVIALEENGLLDSEGNKIGELPRKIDQLIVIPFGAEVFEPVFNKLPIERYKKGFENAVELYGLLNDDKEYK